MDILLDTHILLWHLVDDARLSKQKSQIIEDPQNRKFFSMASLWEIAIKFNIGKLDIRQPLAMIVPEEITILNILVPHLENLKAMPLHHKDPFDRLIISQALVENMVIMTDDSHFSLYDVRLI